ncbi:MAG: MoaD/ThiS family protein [Halovenus sp.]
MAKQVQNRDGSGRDQEQAVAKGEAATSDESTTTVEVRLTGHVRTAVGEGQINYTFEGETLREFLESFFEEYGVRDMIIANTEGEATTRGWAPELEELPGENYSKNPEGEQTRCYARVTVNGTFNEHIQGLDTELNEGDRVGLMYPFIYCC